MSAVPVDDWEPTDTLSEWSVRNDPYAAPETGRAYLAGLSAKRNGKPITTSRIADARGRLVRTASGSVYRLGIVSAKYREWLREMKIPYNPKEPIKMKSPAEAVAS